MSKYRVNGNCSESKRFKLLIIAGYVESFFAIVQLSVTLKQHFSAVFHG